MVRTTAHHRPVSLECLRRGGARGPDEPIRRRQLSRPVRPSGGVRARVAHRRARRTPRHGSDRLPCKKPRHRGRPAGQRRALAADRCHRMPRQAETPSRLGSPGPPSAGRGDRARDRRVAGLDAAGRRHVSSRAGWHADDRHRRRRHQRHLQRVRDHRRGGIRRSGGARHGHHGRHDHGTPVAAHERELDHLRVRPRGASRRPQTRATGSLPLPRRSSKSHPRTSRSSTGACDPRGHHTPDAPLATSPGS